MKQQVDDLGIVIAHMWCKQTLQQLLQARANSFQILDISEQWCEEMWPHQAKYRILSDKLNSLSSSVADSARRARYTAQERCQTSTDVTTLTYVRNAK